MRHGFTEFFCGNKLPKAFATSLLITPAFAASSNAAAAPLWETAIADYTSTVSIAGAIGSSVVFALLIVARLVSDSRARHEAAFAARTRQRLLVHLSNPLSDPRKAILIDRNSIISVAKIAPSLLRIQKGASFDRILDTLGKIGVKEYCLNRVSSRRATARIESIRLLAYWHSSEVKSQIASCMQDKNRDVRLAAVDALASAQDAAYFPEILQAFCNTNTFSTPLITDALTKLGPSISPTLITVVADEAIPTRVRVAGLIALCGSATPRGLYNVALDLTLHQDADLRATAFATLFKLGYHVPLERLSSGKSDRDWRVRQSVADLTQNMPHLPMEILVDLLDDENWLVALRAGQILASAGPGGRKILHQMSSGTDEKAARARLVIGENTGIKHANH